MTQLNRFTPGCGCCTTTPTSGDPCTFCSTGTTPAQWQVVLSGVANQSCTSCTQWNATWILDQNFPFGTAPCQFGTHPSDFCASGAVPDIQLTINSTQYICLVTTNTLNARFALRTGISSPRDCEAVSGLDLPFETDATGTCAFGAATCTITAL